MNTVKVVTLRDLSSVSQGYVKKGQEVELPEETAKFWVENGLANYIESGDGGESSNAGGAEKPIGVPATGKRKRS